MSASGGANRPFELAPRHLGRTDDLVELCVTVLLGARTGCDSGGCTPKAPPGQIFAAIVGQASLYLMLGGLAGSGLSEARHLIFVPRLPAAGASVIPLVTLFMGFCGILGAWDPIRRALAIQPSDALRHE